MFEKRHQPLASRTIFFLRLLYSILFSALFMALSLYIGMLGYHVFEKMPWVDAFANASMILSGMGPFGPMSTTAGKIFARCYALFSGLAFILSMAVFLSPVFHRALHIFHLEDDKK